MKSYLVLGDWNAICDQCGRKFKASQLKKRWDGLMVCSEDFETRHPQEFVRGREDSGRVPWTRPDRDLNAQGLPIASVAPAINCAALSYIFLPKVVAESGSQTIRKAQTPGPVTINGTITVECTWEIL